MPDVRLAYINRLQQGMADIRVSRHYLRKDVIICLNNSETDIYMDVSEREEFVRVAKKAIVQKTPGLSYVQESYDILPDYDEQVPWTVAFTLSGLPHPPKMNDLIIIEGRVYVVSKTRPSNRELPGLVECLVYPERDSRFVNDELAIYKVRFRVGLEELSYPDYLGKVVTMDVIYGGCPLYMSFEGKDWGKFYISSNVKVPEEATGLYLMDANSEVVTYEFGAVEQAKKIISPSDVVYR